MNPTQPPVPRHTIHYVQDTLLIFTFTRRSWWRVITQTIAAILMPVVIFLAIASLGFIVIDILGLPNEGMIYNWINATLWLLNLICGLLFMLGIGMMMLSAIQFQLKGQEIITVNAQGINTRKYAFSKKYMQMNLYRAKYIHNLRVEKHQQRQRNQTHTTWPLTFDYGTITIRISDQATQTENQQILAAIHKKFPQYRN